MNTTKLLVLLSLTLSLLACGKNEDVSSTTAPAHEADTALVPESKVTPVPAGTDSEDITISKVQVGSTLDENKQVMKENTTFGPNDTVYVVVETTGTGKGTMKAKWHYIKNGEQENLEDTSQDIESTGKASTEFHILQNDGWKKGSYQVEILLDDKQVAVKEFRVE